MGLRYIFNCSNCGYTAEVSGGPDCGEALSTQTILCFDCKELIDVPASILEGIAIDDSEFEFTGEFDGDTPPRFRLIRIRCPKSASHVWRQWNAPNVCPRCGSLIQKPVAPAALWD